VQALARRDTAIAQAVNAELAAGIALAAHRQDMAGHDGLAAGVRTVSPQA